MIKTQQLPQDEVERFDKEHKAFKVAEHSFQEPLPNSPLL